VFGTASARAGSSTHLVSSVPVAPRHFAPGGESKEQLHWLRAGAAGAEMVPTVFSTASARAGVVSLRTKKKIRGQPKNTLHAVCCAVFINLLISELFQNQIF